VNQWFVELQSGFATSENYAFASVATFSSGVLQHVLWSLKAKLPREVCVAVKAMLVDVAPKVAASETHEYVGRALAMSFSLN
jgi:hypothetical protein